MTVADLLIFSVMGSPSGLTKLFWNGNELPFTPDTVTREWTSTLTYTKPAVNLPVLRDLGVSDPLSLLISMS